MKNRFTVIVLLFFVFCNESFAQSLIDQFKRTGIDSISELHISIRRYEGAFVAFVSQPLDHKDPEGEHFQQRIFIRHRGFEKPVVFVTEGYSAAYAAQPAYDEELAESLDANLIVVEHRFFGKSVPNSKNWKHLNLLNATADLHAINQMLKKVYQGSWLSTGISKGGQTTIYYRYFYPDDVKVSVPYVAPLNFSVADKRVYHFLDTVADAGCRNQLKEIQLDLLKRKDIFLPMFSDSAQHRNLTFERIGGVESAYEHNVLELGFAYWQWHPVSCQELPSPGGQVEEVFNLFADAAGYDFFADQSIEVYQPFFYQALTEMGFYSYQTKPFQSYLTINCRPDFNHTLPANTQVKYRPVLSKRVNRWLRKHGNNFVYIYGGYDAWSSTAVQPGKRTNAIKLVLPGGSHATRLIDFDPEISQSVVNQLKTWME